MKAVRQQDCETLSLKDSPASKELKVLFFSSSNANRAQSRGGYKVLCASTQPAQHSFLMITVERMLPDEKKRERQNICLFSLIYLYTNITYRHQSMVFLYCIGLITASVALLFLPKSLNLSSTIEGRE